MMTFVDWLLNSHTRSPILLLDAVSIALSWGATTRQAATICLTCTRNRRLVAPGPLVTRSLAPSGPLISTLGRRIIHPPAPRMMMMTMAIITVTITTATIITATMTIGIWSTPARVQDVLLVLAAGGHKDKAGLWPSQAPAQNVLQLSFATPPSV